MKRSQTLQKTLNLHTFSKETFAGNHTNQNSDSVNELNEPLYTQSSIEENSVSVSNPNLRNKLKPPNLMLSQFKQSQDQP